MTEHVGNPITPVALAAEMARLNAAFGSPKDRTPDQVRIMASEWFKALSSYGVKSLRRAVDNLIRNSKWWPALAEVYAMVKADHDGWEDALGCRDEPRRGLTDWTGRGEIPPKIEPLSPVQVAARKAAAVARMKAEYKSLFEEQSWTDRFEQWTPASQDMTVSDALRNSCAAKRARGEPTCEPACQRRPEGCRYAKAQDQQP